MHYVAEDALLILLLLLPKYGDYGFALYHLIHGLLGIESITPLELQSQPKDSS